MGNHRVLQTHLQQLHADTQTETSGRGILLADNQEGLDEHGHHIGRGMDGERLKSSKHLLDGLLGDETAEDARFGVHDVGRLRNTGEEVLEMNGRINTWS